MPYHLRKKTKKINKLLPQRHNEFDDITLINWFITWLINWFITEGRSLKDFRGYQNLLELFENLKNVDVDSKEVFKIR